MSTIEKLKRRFFEKPIRNDITQKEIERLAKHYGCDIYTGGNHQKRIVHVGTGTLTALHGHKVQAGSQSLWYQSWNRSHRDRSVLDI